MTDYNPEERPFRNPVGPVKLYCPRCEGLYACRNRHASLLGVYFGTSFAHVFFQAYPELLPKELPVPYVPHIFGFRIHASKGLTHIKNEYQGDYRELEAAMKKEEANTQQHQDVRTLQAPPVAGAKVII